MVAVDVNPDYIERTRARYTHRLPGFELVCADVQSNSLEYDPVDFTYAALLFEYVGVPATMKTLKRNSRPGAVLTTVVQLPHTTIDSISPSPYQSLGALASIIAVVEPEALSRAAADVGFSETDSTIVDVPCGKQFCVQTFRADSQYSGHA